MTRLVTTTSIFHSSSKDFVSGLGVVELRTTLDLLVEEQNRRSFSITRDPFGLFVLI